MSTTSASSPAARYGLLALAVIALHAMALCEVGCAQRVDQQLFGASQPDASPSLGDGWRRTVRGWEQLTPGGKAATGREAPTQHVALVQVWPAAWAACVVLSILRLAAAGAEGKEIDARLARGDELGYDLGRAA